MNIKKDLKDMGMVLITPAPAKLRFAGIDYKRAARNLTVVGVGLYVAAAAVFIGAPVIDNAIWTLKQKFKKNHEKE